MYKIDDIYTYETAEDAAQHIVENIDESLYDDWLDEIDGPFAIGGSTFYPSEILSKCDPIAYRCGYSDFTNYIYDEVLYDLERMNDDDCITEYEQEVLFVDLDEKRELLSDLYDQYNEMLECSPEDWKQDEFDSLQSAIAELEDEINEIVA